MLETKDSLDLLIVGDGQLGRLITKAAHRQNLTVGVIGSSETSSTAQVADSFFAGDITRLDQSLISAFERSRAFAIDTEHVDTEFLLSLPYQNRFLFPIDYLKYTQDKRLQHIHLASKGLLLPRFRPDIESFEDFTDAASQLHFLGVLQTGNTAYDGRGNAVVNGKNSLQAAWEKLGTRGKLFMEEYVPFRRELALQAMSGIFGELVIFPLVESTHVDGQLYTTEAPAIVNPNLETQIDYIAKSIVKAIPGIGLRTIELFELEDSPDQQRLLINEICIGRPHNSGHHTEGSLLNSQFDQIIKLARSQRLGFTTFRPGVTVSRMLNLLGSRNGNREILGVDEVVAKTGLVIEIYGKELRKARKLGHLNYAGNDRLEGKEKVLQGLEMLNDFNDGIFLSYPI